MKLGISSTLQFVVLLTTSIPLFVLDVSCLPLNPCKYTNDLLYGSTVETAFSGELFPVANDPSPISLFQYVSSLIRCFIPGQEETSSFFPEKTTLPRTYPTLLSINDEHYLCLFGCLRVLYRITIFSGDKTKAAPGTFYVLIISDREKTSCPRRDGLKPSTKSDSARQSFLGRGHEPHPVSKSINIVPKEHSVASNHIVVRKTPYNPNLIKNCVPTEKYSGRSALLNKPKSWSQYWQSALLPNTTKSVCNGIYKNLVERYKLASGMKTTILDYNEMVKNMFLNQGNHGKSALFPKVTEICYVHPVYKSVKVVSSKFTDSICRFGCLKQFLKYELTGDTVLFIHSFYCRESVFYPCHEDTRLNPGIINLRLRRPTTTSSRKPISAVLHVTEPSDDRAKAVRKAIRRLRRSPGFGNIQQSEIKTEVVRKGKYRYRVFLRFNVFLLEH